MTGGSISARGPNGLRLFGDVVTNAAAASATLSGKLDLGGVARTFNVGDGAAIYDLVIDGVVSNGGVIKQGPGSMGFFGGTPNTYTGATTVNAGGLTLAKLAGITAVAGPLVIGDGSGPLGIETAADLVHVLSANQIADSQPITIAATGRLELAGTETIGGLTMTGGVVSIFESAVLTLTSDITFNASLAATFIGLLDLSRNPGALRWARPPGTSTLRTFQVFNS